MEIKKFNSNNFDDINLKEYEEADEENLNNNQDKDAIEFIRRQEYLLQMKTEVKFPIHQVLQKFKYIQNDEEYKLCTKIRIDSSKNCLIKSIQSQSLLNNKNLDISNEIFEDDLNTIKNNMANNIYDENEESQTGYVFIFQDKIILTTNQIENLKKSLKKNPVLFSIKFSQFCIYRLIINDISQNELYLQFYNDIFTEKKDLMLKFLVTRDSFCVHHYIKKYFILQWQIIFESTVILDYKKLIYNRHYILLKYNRYGKCQERTLLVTNGLLINIKHDFKKHGLNFSIKNIKWAIGIKAIKKMIIMIESKKENKLKLYLDKIISNAEVIEYLGNTKFLKFKEERNFEFYSVDERNDFVGIMRRNYYLLTQKFINIDSYPSLNRKKISAKAVGENNIFDSSFESSEEEQKIDDKEKEDEKEKEEEKEKEKEKEKKEGKEKEKEVIENKINIIEDNANKELNQNENINEKFIPKKDKTNENIIKNDKKEDKKNNENNGNDKKKKKNDKNQNNDKDKNKKNNNKKGNKNNQKKQLKKTKKSIFDDNYNSIFDSDYESEEDN